MSSRPFENKCCLITGAGSGIGRATAIKLASQGARLALQDINAAGLGETERLCNGSHGLWRFDVADSAECDTFAKASAVATDGIDMVFNCAGVNPTAYDLTETTDEYWDKLVNTNLKGQSIIRVRFVGGLFVVDMVGVGTYNITRACIPHMKSGGSIVNVSSTMGINAAVSLARSLQMGEL